MYKRSRCDTENRSQPRNTALLHAARDDVENGRTRRQQQQDRRHGKDSDRRRVWNDDVHATKLRLYEYGPTLADAGQTCQPDRPRPLPRAPYNFSENNVTAGMGCVLRFALIGLLAAPVLLKNVRPVIIQVDTLFRVKRFRLDRRAQAPGAENEGIQKFRNQ